MKVKICGLKRVEDVAYVNHYLPDYVGFVFAGEKRRINKEQALELKRLLDPSIQVVGVFVNEPLALIRELVMEGVIDLIQLHGDEEEAYVHEVKQLNVPVIRACRVKERLDVITAQASVADYLLFDTYTKQEYGGSGKTFDHELLSDNQRAYFLAGGITTDNIQHIITNVKPYAIDVSSGVETDGIKDEEKIRKLMEIARRNTAQERRLL